MAIPTINDQFYNRLPVNTISLTELLGEDHLFFKIPGVFKIHMRTISTYLSTNAFLYFFFILFKAILFDVNFYSFTIVYNFIFLYITGSYHFPEIKIVGLRHVLRKRAKPLKTDQYGENDGIYPVNTKLGAFFRI